MADFTVRIASGVTVVDWTDGASIRRINPRQGLPLKRYMAAVNGAVVVKMAVDGVEDLPDSGLDGRPFVPFFVDCPRPRPRIVADVGLSSVFSFIPIRDGHYHFRVRRRDGGIWHVHVDAV